jgi:hypothetical protein
MSSPNQPLKDVSYGMDVSITNTLQSKHSFPLVKATQKAAKLLVSLDRINRPFVCTHTGTLYSTQALLVEGCACMRLYRNTVTMESTELTSCQSQILAQLH